MIFSKRSQAWGIDLMVAIGIFSVAIVVFFVYSMNQTNEARDTLEDLLYDGKTISNSLLSEGSPKDWNSDNVIKLGILDEGKINNTKLERFYDLSLSDYARTKTLFKIRTDYYFFLDEEMIIDGEDVVGIGKPGFDIEDIDEENIIKIKRFVIYNDKPVNAYFYVWR